MSNSSIKFTKGENETQYYYDATVARKYLLVYSLKKNPGVWYGMAGGVMVYDKRRNDEQRKKQGLPEHAFNELQVTHLLVSSSPQKMMTAVEECAISGKCEYSF